MTNEVEALRTIFTEFYYWVTVVLMFLIHVGFCMYEVGASRYKHHQHTLMKNTMLIPLVTVTWFLFGWWIYWAFPTGPGLAASITQKTEPIAIAKIPNAKVVILSMIAPETMEAAVQENNRNAAQKTPEMWSPKLTAINWLVAV